MYYLKKNKKDDGALSETLTTQIKDKAEVVFNLLDSDDDGHLRYEDIEAFVASCDQGFQEGSDIEETKKNAKDVFARMDKSGDGKINMKEWMVWITVLYPTRAERTALFNIVEGPSRRPTLLPPPAPSGPPSPFCFPSVPSAVHESDTAGLMGVPSFYIFESGGARCVAPAQLPTRGLSAMRSCPSRLSVRRVGPPGPRRPPLHGARQVRARAGAPEADQHDSGHRQEGERDLKPPQRRILRRRR